MSLVTILWSTAAAACLTIGIINLFIWFRLKQSKANLLFSLAALGASAVAYTELIGLTAQDIPAYAFALKFQTLGVFVMLVSLVWFIYFYFGTGKKWLALLITFFWCFSIILNFIAPYSLVYSEIIELKQLSLPWGELYTIALGTDHPLRFISDIPSVLIVIFFIDSSIRLWKKGK